MYVLCSSFCRVSVRSDSSICLSRCSNCFRSASCLVSSCTLACKCETNCRLASYGLLYCCWICCGKLLWAVNAALSRCSSKTGIGWLGSSMRILFSQRSLYWASIWRRWACSLTLFWSFWRVSAWSWVRDVCWPSLIVLWGTCELGLVWMIEGGDGN